MSLDGAKLICHGANGVPTKVVPAKGRKFTMGYYSSCDLELTDARALGVHCEIEIDAFGRVRIINLSQEHPMQLNGSHFTTTRMLLDGYRLKILDNEYTWEFPRSTCAHIEDVTCTTPEKRIGPPEQLPMSCPDMKNSELQPIYRRLTVHNFAYCINSDDSNCSNEEHTDETEIVKNKMNTTSTSRQLETSSQDNNSVRDIKTPEREESQLYNLGVTPKIDLLNATQNKENTSTQKKKKLLSLCHQSDVVITSYSPRETGVRIEKSFTAILKPSSLATANATATAGAANTPKSVYSTPKSVFSELNEDSNSRDFLDFSTPSSSRKAHGRLANVNTSMHLIDLTTPSKLRSKIKATPQSMKKTPITAKSDSDVPSSIESVVMVESTDESSSVIEVSDAETPHSPVAASKTPSKVSAKAHTTPMRTPQSLMRRALLTSAKKRIGNSRVQASPVTPKNASARVGLHSSARSAVDSTRRSLLMTSSVGRPQLPSTSTNAGISNAQKARKTLTLDSDINEVKSPKGKNSTVANTRKSMYLPSKRISPIALKNKLVAKARNSLCVTPKNGSSRTASMRTPTSLMKQHTPIARSSPNSAIKSSLKAESTPLVTTTAATTTTKATTIKDDESEVDELSRTFTIDASGNAETLNVSAEAVRPTIDKPLFNDENSNSSEELLKKIDSVLNKSDELKAKVNESLVKVPIDDLYTSSANVSHVAGKRSEENDVCDDPNESDLFIPETQEIVREMPAMPQTAVCANLTQYENSFTLAMNDDSDIFTNKIDNNTRGSTDVEGKIEVASAEENRAEEYSNAEQLNESDVFIPETQAIVNQREVERKSIESNLGLATAYEEDSLLAEPIRVVRNSEMIDEDIFEDSQDDFEKSSKKIDKATDEIDAPPESKNVDGGDAIVDDSESVNSKTKDQVIEIIKIKDTNDTISIDDATEKLAADEAHEKQANVSQEEEKNITDNVKIDATKGSISSNTDKSPQTKLADLTAQLPADDSDADELEEVAPTVEEVIVEEQLCKVETDTSDALPPETCILAEDSHENSADNTYEPIGNTTLSSDQDIFEEEKSNVPGKKPSSNTTHESEKTIIPKDIFADKTEEIRIETIEIFESEMNNLQSNTKAAEKKMEIIEIFAVEELESEHVNKIGKEKNESEKPSVALNEEHINETVCETLPSTSAAARRSLRRASFVKTPAKAIEQQPPLLNYINEQAIEEVLAVNEVGPKMPRRSLRRSSMSAASNLALEENLDIPQLTPRRSSRRASMCSTNKLEAETESSKGPKRRASCSAEQPANDSIPFTPKRLRMRRSQMVADDANNQLFLNDETANDMGAIVEEAFDDLAQESFSDLNTIEKKLTPTTVKIAEENFVPDENICSELNTIDTTQQTEEKNNDDSKHRSSIDQQEQQKTIECQSFCDVIEDEKNEEETALTELPKDVIVVNEESKHDTEIINEDYALEISTTDNIRTTPEPLTNKNTLINEIDKVDLHGMRELLKTPKSSSTPRFKGMREMLQTPKQCSTPIMGGIKQLLNTPKRTKADTTIANATLEHVGLDKFFKTPRAKHLMVPNDPASAVLKESDIDSVAHVHSTEYDLNATNCAYMQLTKIFETPVASRFSERLKQGSDEDDDETNEHQGEEDLPTTSKSTLKKATSPPESEVHVSTDEEICGLPSSIKTPIQKIDECATSKMLNHPSPFSQSTVISDLPKTDVQEWVESLENEPSDQNDSLVAIEEHIENEVSFVEGASCLQDVDPLMNSKTFGEKSMTSNVDISVDVDKNEEGDVSEQLMYDISSVSSMRDPLTSTAHKSRTEKRFESDIQDSDDAEMSGLQLLDDTTDSVMEPLMITCSESMATNVTFGADEDKNEADAEKPEITLIELDVDNETVGNELKSKSKGDQSKIKEIADENNSVDKKEEETEMTTNFTDETSSMANSTAASLYSLQAGDKLETATERSEITILEVDEDDETVAEELVEIADESYNGDEQVVVVPIGAETIETPDNAVERLTDAEISVNEQEKELQPTANNSEIVEIFDEDMCIEHNVSETNNEEPNDLEIETFVAVADSSEFIEIFDDELAEVKNNAQSQDISSVECTEVKNSGKSLEADKCETFTMEDKNVSGNDELTADKTVENSEVLEVVDDGAEQLTDTLEAAMPNPSNQLEIVEIDDEDIPELSLRNLDSVLIADNDSVGDNSNVNQETSKDGEEFVDQLVENASEIETDEPKLTSPIEDDDQIEMEALVFEDEEHIDLNESVASPKELQTADEEKKNAVTSTVAVSKITEDAKDLQEVSTTVGALELSVIEQEPAIHSESGEGTESVAEDAEVVPAKENEDVESPQIEASVDSTSMIVEHAAATESNRNDTVVTVNKTQRIEEIVEISSRESSEMAEEQEVFDEDAEVNVKTSAVPKKNDEKSPHKSNEDTEEDSNDYNQIQIINDDIVEISSDATEATDSRDSVPSIETNQEIELSITVDQKPQSIEASAEAVAEIGSLIVDSQEDVETTAENLESIEDEEIPVKETAEECAAESNVATEIESHVLDSQEDAENFDETSQTVDKMATISIDEEAEKTEFEKAADVIEILSVDSSEIEESSQADLAKSGEVVKCEAKQTIENKEEVKLEESEANKPSNETSEKQNKDVTEVISFDSSSKKESLNFIIAEIKSMQDVEEEVHPSEENKTTVESLSSDNTESLSQIAKDHEAKIEKILAKSRKASSDIEIIEESSMRRKPLKSSEENEEMEDNSENLFANTEIEIQIINEEVSEIKDVQSSAEKDVAEVEVMAEDVEEKEVVEKDDLNEMMHKNEKSEESKLQTSILCKDTAYDESENLEIINENVQVVKKTPTAPDERNDEGQAATEDHNSYETKVIKGSEKEVEKNETEDRKTRTQRRKASSDIELIEEILARRRQRKTSDKEGSAKDILKDQVKETSTNEMEIINEERQEVEEITIATAERIDDAQATKKEQISEEINAIEEVKEMGNTDKPESHGAKKTRTQRRKSSDVEIIEERPTRRHQRKPSDKEGSAKDILKDQAKETSRNEMENINEERQEEEEITIATAERIDDGKETSTNEINIINEERQEVEEITIATTGRIDDAQATKKEQISEEINAIEGVKEMGNTDKPESHGAKKTRTQRRKSSDVEIIEERPTRRHQRKPSDKEGLEKDISKDQAKETSTNEMEIINEERQEEEEITIATAERIDDTQATTKEQISEEIYAIEEDKPETHGAKKMRKQRRKASSDVEIIEERPTLRHQRKPSDKEGSAKDILKDQAKETFTNEMEIINEERQEEEEITIATAERIDDGKETSTNEMKIINEERQEVEEITITTAERIDDGKETSTNEINIINEERQEVEEITTATAERIDDAQATTKEQISEEINAIEEDKPESHGAKKTRKQRRKASSDVEIIEERPTRRRQRKTSDKESSAKDILKDQVKETSTNEMEIINEERQEVEEITIATAERIDDAQATTKEQISEEINAIEEDKPESHGAKKTRKQRRKASSDVEIIEERPTRRHQRKPSDKEDSANDKLKDQVKETATKELEIINEEAQQVEEITVATEERSNESQVQRKDKKYEEIEVIEGAPKEVKETDDSEKTAIKKTLPERRKASSDVEVIEEKPKRRRQHKVSHKEESTNYSADLSTENDTNELKIINEEVKKVDEIRSVNLNANPDRQMSQETKHSEEGGETKSNAENVKEQTKQDDVADKNASSVEEKVQTFEVEENPRRRGRGQIQKVPSSTACVQSRKRKPAANKAEQSEEIPHRRLRINSDKDEEAFKAQNEQPDRESESIVNEEVLDADEALQEANKLDDEKMSADDKDLTVAAFKDKIVLEEVENVAGASKPRSRRRKSMVSQAENEAEEPSKKLRKATTNASTKIVSEVVVLLDSSPENSPERAEEVIEHSQGANKQTKGLKSPLKTEIVEEESHAIAQTRRGARRISTDVAEKSGVRRALKSASLPQEESPEVDEIQAHKKPSEVPKSHDDAVHESKPRRRGRKQVLELKEDCETQNVKAGIIVEQFTVVEESTVVHREQTKRTQKKPARAATRKGATTAQKPMQSDETDSLEHQVEETETKEVIKASDINIRRPGRRDRKFSTGNMDDATPNLTGPDLHKSEEPLVYNTEEIAKKSNKGRAPIRKGGRKQHAISEETAMIAIDLTETKPSESKATDIEEYKAVVPTATHNENQTLEEKASFDDTPNRREGRNLPRRNYDETSDDEIPTASNAGRSRRLRKAAKTTAGTESNKSTQPQKEFSSPVETKEPEKEQIEEPIDRKKATETATTAPLLTTEEELTPSKREVRNVPRRNYEETSDEEISKSHGRSKRTRKPTTKALLAEEQRAATPKRQRAALLAASVDGGSAQTQTPKRGRTRGKAKAVAPTDEHDEPPHKKMTPSPCSSHKSKSENTQHEHLTTPKTSTAKISPTMPTVVAKNKRTRARKATAPESHDEAAEQHNDAPASKKSKRNAKANTISNDEDEAATTDIELLQEKPVTAKPRTTKTTTARKVRGKQQSGIVHKDDSDDVVVAPPNEDTSDHSNKIQQGEDATILKVSTTTSQRSRNARARKVRFEANDTEERIVAPNEPTTTTKRTTRARR